MESKIIHPLFNSLNYSDDHKLMNKVSNVKIRTSIKLDLSSESEFINEKNGQYLQIILSVRHTKVSTGYSGKLISKFYIPEESSKVVIDSCMRYAIRTFYNTISMRYDYLHENLYGLFEDFLITWNTDSIKSGFLGLTGEKVYHIDGKKLDKKEYLIYQINDELVINEKINADYEINQIMPKKKTIKCKVKFKFVDLIIPL